MLAKEPSFNGAHLEELRKRYAQVSHINPDSQVWKGLITYIDGLSDKLLQQLVEARIRWLSVLAMQTQGKRRGAPAGALEHVQALLEQRKQILGQLGPEVRE